MTDTSDTLPPADTVWEEKLPLIDRIPRSLAMAGLMATFLLVWQGVHSFGIVSPIIMPSPGETLADMAFVGRNILTGGYLLGALWVTLKAVLVGFFFAASIGFLLGLLVGETSFGERAVLPYLVAIDTMPKIAFAPLFVAWFGFGIASKVAMAAFISTFPVIIGTAAGLHAADQNARMLCQSLGATRWQMLVKMKLPTGLPQIFTGLKIAAASVMAGAIAAEFLGGGQGFGEQIRLAASQLRTTRVFSLIFYLSICGFLVFWAVVMLERWLVFWRRPSTSQRMAD